MFYLIKHASTMYHAIAWTAVNYDDALQAVANKNGRDVATYTLQFSNDQTCPDPEVSVLYLF
jgi:hypothetical protein